MLDTDTCIGAMRRQEEVLWRMATLSPLDCAISAITNYELVTGVEKTARPEQEREKVHLFLSMLTVLPFDEFAAECAAKIRADLEKRGSPIGPYVVLIAGHAVANQLGIVTHNTREFFKVPGLQVEDWQIPSRDKT